MERKASTPMRENRRRYEDMHKEARKAASKVFGTSVPREDCEEIETFLKTYGISKVDLIYAGYEALKESVQK